MMVSDGSIAERYRDFAAYAEGDSTCFAEWAHGVAGDAEVQAWLADLPRPKQQPNLVFAAARWHGAPAPAPYGALREALLADDGRIRATILERATQTNEVGRLATLTPAFAGGRGRRAAGAGRGRRERRAVPLPRPLLLRLGDRERDACARAAATSWPAWSRATSARRRSRRWRGAPASTCTRSTSTTTTRWRGWRCWCGPSTTTAGARWPPRSRSRGPSRRGSSTGDLLERLPRLVEEAAAHARVVVFHSAVAAYLDDDGRARLDAMMRRLVADGACHWVSNEAPDVLPSVSATAPHAADARSSFVLGVDGRAVAWTHGHGRSMTWFG